MAAHQLRVPLTSVRWFTEMLLHGDVGPLTPEQQNVAQEISSATARMSKLISLLLQITRVESGRLKVEPTPLNLKSITQEVIIELKSFLENKSQKIEISTAPDALPLMPVDYDIIWQVIQNLISNASRYSPDGGKIFISIVAKKDRIEYSVRDEGIGIPAAEQARIFEKFYRATNVLKPVPDGSGLGLALVKSLVDGWGGKVWFESKEGEGSTFFFTIPLQGMKVKEGEVKLRV